MKEEVHICPHGYEAVSGDMAGAHGDKKIHSHTQMQAAQQKNARVFVITERGALALNMQRDQVNMAHAYHIREEIVIIRGIRGQIDQMQTLIGEAA